MADHGAAPYAEAAAKGQARMSTLQRIAQLVSGAGQGLSAVDKYSSPGAALFQGFTQSYGLANASRAAAAQYAQKQMAAEQARADREIQNKHLEALTTQASKPSEPFDKQPWWMAPGVDPAVKAAMLGKESHVATKEPKAAKTPTPKPIPRRIPAKLTEQQIIDSINQETDPAALSAYFMGRGAADSADIRRAAQLRANDIARMGR